MTGGKGGKEESPGIARTGSFSIKDLILETPAIYTDEDSIREPIDEWISKQDIASLLSWINSTSPIINQDDGLALSYCLTKFTSKDRLGLSYIDYEKVISAIVKKVTAAKAVAWCIKHPDSQLTLAAILNAQNITTDMLLKDVLELPSYIDKKRIYEWLIEQDPALKDKFPHVAGELGRTSSKLER